MITWNSRKAFASFLITRALSLLLCASVVIGTSLEAADLNVLETRLPSALDPHNATNPQARRFVTLYAKPLLEYVATGPDGIRLELASSVWLNKNDPLQILVALRSDAYFYHYVDHPDGTSHKDSIRVTPEDVVASFKLILHDSSVFNDAPRSQDILRRVAKAEKLNDSMVAFTYKPGQKVVKRSLTFPIVPAEVFAEGYLIADDSKTPKQAAYRKRPWASGPFTFKRLTRTGKYRFLRNGKTREDEFSDIYISQKAEMTLMTELRNRADFETKKCIPQMPIGYRSDVSRDGHHFQTLGSQVIEQIIFNCRKAPLNDNRVRKALSMYIDRESLINSHMRNEAVATSAPFPHNTAQYCKTCDIPFHTYNVERADQLLEEAKWRKNDRGRWEKNGKTMKIELIGYKSSSRSRVANLVSSIKDAWKSHGIDAERSLLLPAEYRKRLREGKFDAAFNRLEHFVAPRIDRHFVSDGPENYSGWRNSNVDRLWKALFNSENADKPEVWKNLHKQIAEGVPSAFLWSPVEYAVYTTNIRVGTQFDPTNFLVLVEKWKIVE